MAKKRQKWGYFIVKIKNNMRFHHWHESYNHGNLACRKSVHQNHFRGIAAHVFFNKSKSCCGICTASTLVWSMSRVLKRAQLSWALAIEQAMAERCGHRKEFVLRLQPSETITEHIESKWDRFFYRSDQFSKVRGRNNWILKYVEHYI